MIKPLSHHVVHEHCIRSVSGPIGSAMDTEGRTVARRFVTRCKRAPGVRVVFCFKSHPEEDVPGNPQQRLDALVALAVAAAVVFISAAPARAHGTLLQGGEQHNDMRCSMIDSPPSKVRSAIDYAYLCTTR